MVELTPEVRKKIEDVASEMGLDVEAVKEQLDYIEKRKKTIKGVWSLPNWVWIATEQGTKETWYGVVFSPIVTRGEWGSWYVGELEDLGASVVVQPEYRWKLTSEEMEKLRAFRKLGGVS